MSSIKGHKTVFRYPRDPTIRAVVMGSIDDPLTMGYEKRNRLQKDGMVLVNFKAPKLQSVAFWWKLSDLLYKYEYEIEEWTLKGSACLDSGYVYAPYIPLQIKDKV